MDFFEELPADFFAIGVGVGVTEGVGAAAAWKSFTLIVGLEKVKLSAESEIHPSRSTTLVVAT